MSSPATPAAILVVVGVGLLYYAVWSPKGVLNKNPITGVADMGMPPWDPLSSSGSFGEPPANNPNNPPSGIDPGTTDQRDFSEGWAVRRYQAGLPVYNVSIPYGVNYQGQLAAFRDAIGKGEGGYQSVNASGHLGRYQISKHNWPAWSKHYFGRELDWHSPANQDAVFNARVTDYYNNYSKKYPSNEVWQHIAVAWSGGPGVGKLPKSQWNQHMFVYASGAMHRMNEYFAGLQIP